MTELVNQISFLGTLIFTLGLAALLYRQDIMNLKIGSILVFSASMLNIGSFSEFNSGSVEGNVISILIIIVMFVHLYIQEILKHVDV